MPSTANDPAFVTLRADFFQSPGSVDEVAFVTPPSTELPRSKEALIEPVSGGCCVPELVRYAERGDKLAVLRLLENGEDPNIQDDFGLTALHGAAKKGHDEIVALLLLKGAEVDICASAWKGEAPIHYACKYGRTKVLEMLLMSGANPSLLTQEGRSPLDYAMERKHRGCGQILARAMQGDTLWSL